MARTYNDIYYNDDENSTAEILDDMKKLAQSTDDAIEKSKYNDTQIKKDILNMKTEIAAKDNEQDNKILQLQNEKAELEKELKEAQEDFYQNSIRGQASGEYIHVEDSSNCRSRIGIGGNHEQETRSGKNFLELMEGTYSNNGVTAVVKDGVVTLNGTATAISFVGINLLKSIELTNDKTYHLSAFNEKTAGDGTNYCSLRINQDNIQVLFNKTNANGSITTNLKISYITIRTQSGITYNNFVVKPQLEIGNGTDTWEQGGASPSPDYLSQVKAVGDNVNLFDKDDEQYILKNMFIDGSSKKISSYTGTYSIALPIKPNTTYTIYRGLGTKDSYRVATSDNNVLGSSINNLSSFIDTKYYTIKTSNESKYLIIWYYWDSKETYTEEEIRNSIKIVEGTEIGEYSPYGQGCINEVICNKNRLDKNNYRLGYISSTGGFVANNLIALFDYISVKPNTVLTFSQQKNYEYRYCYYDENKKFIYRSDAFTTKTSEITIPDNVNYIVFFINFGISSITQDIIDEDKIQVEEGSTTDYVEHKEQSYIIPTQREMLEGDYFDWDNEEEVHTWNKLVLNGTEKIGISGASTDEILAVVYDINNAIDGFGYSNCFLYSSQVALNKLNVYNNGKNLRVCVDKSKFVDLESFKSKIIELYNEGTPVVVYYKLVTPTRLAFTDEQKAVAKKLNNARTYKNVTNIYSTDEISPILSLDYAKDLETLLTSKESEV